MNDHVPPLAERLLNLKSSAILNRESTDPNFTSFLDSLAHTVGSVTIFPDGDVKVTGTHRTKKYKRSHRSDRLSEIERQEIAAKRAGTMVRDICKYFNFVYLWTLNYRGPVTERAKVYKDFVRFLRVVRCLYPDFVTVAVMEYHTGGGANDGGIHMHFALNEFYDVKFLRKCWWSIVGERMGNVDVQSKLSKDSPRNVGGYLAKYVTKDFSSSPRAFGEHRYFRSESLNVLRKKFYLVAGRFVEHREHLKELLRVYVGHDNIAEWVSDDGWRFCFKAFNTG